MRIFANNHVFGLMASVSLLCLSLGTVACADPQSGQSVGVPTAPPVQAAGSITVHIDSTTARQFDTAFRAIGEQAHVFIISEGTPLQTSLTDKQLADLRERLNLDAPVAAVDAIRYLAEAYDYFIEQPNPHTFLLCKQYTDPADLPCVTFGEITHSLKSILQIVDACSPDGASPSCLTG